MDSAITGDKAVIDLIAHLNAAIANTRLYSADHPQVARYLGNARDAIARLLQARSEITFFIVDQDLVIDRRPLTSPTPQVAQFVQLLSRAAVERITFSAAVSLPELAGLAQSLAADDRRVRSTAGIKVGKVEVRSAGAGQGDAGLTPEVQETLDQFKPVRDRSVVQLRDLYHDLKANRSIPASGFGEIVQSFILGIHKNVPPLHALASLKRSDEYTFTHAVNVCILTMAQAEALGISGQQLHDIGIAASLHDAGKVFVPDEILNKPGKLNEEEWRHMRNHAVRGARQLLRIDGLPKLAFVGALEHHIRYDGTGYPSLPRWQPNLVSQMIAVADMFDAMRSRRPYQEPKPDGLIVKTLRRDSGSAFNPLLVDNFLKLLKR